MPLSSSPSPASPPSPAPSITLLGATGSVGQAALSLLEDRGFSLQALCAGCNCERLAHLSLKHRPRFAALAEPSLGDELARRLEGSGIESGAGEQAVLDAAAMPSDYTLAAISGIAGLAPSAVAVKRGTRLVLANKECVVAGGRWFLDLCESHASLLLPADSEHNALFQMLKGFGSDQSLRKVVLTASGGPFLNRPLDSLAHVTIAEACAHPNFRMGAKISVDSATLMNKGLEVIEAALLFSLPESMIDILIHPQQIVHALIEYEDGTIFAHLGNPDMRQSLQNCLHWPERATTRNPWSSFDWRTMQNLTFQNLEAERFPAPSLARAAIRQGGAMPIALNAANEVAVAAFLASRLPFDAIVPVVERTLCDFSRETFCPTSLEAILTIDARTRRLAQKRLSQSARG